MDQQRHTTDFNPIFVFHLGPEQGNGVPLQADLCSFSFPLVQGPLAAERYERPKNDRAYSSSIRRFKWQGRVFTLCQPVEYRVYCENGVWTYECKSLGILSYDRSRARARENFNEEFAAVWDSIVCEDDSKLAPDAIELKARLKEMVADVKNSAHQDSID